MDDNDSSRGFAPLFIVGAGRSGSTAFFDLLTYATNVVWLTSWIHRKESRLIPRPLFYSLCYKPVIGELLRRRYPPTEGYDFWNALYRGFGTPCRDLVADDVTEKSRKVIRRSAAAMLLPGREQLLFKITGWPRIGFLDAIFPDAKFIHIVRDGRAVANSLLGVRWWHGWQGPANWRWGEMPDEYTRRWVEHGRSFVALAGLQWAILMDAMQAARDRIGADRFLEIRYEDMCREPAESMQRACRFAGLAGEAAVVERASTLRTQNDKWRKDLTPAQQLVLNEILKDKLGLYGYEAG